LRDVFGDYELPTFPRIVNEAISMISSPDVNLSDVGELLGKDPGVSARLLKMVNSATFAPRRPIESVTQAVTMLGRNPVESLLISIAVKRSLPQGSSNGFDSHEFWVMSARRAAMAAEIAGRTDPPSRSATFTAALLLDMAVPVLAARQDGYPAMLAESGHIGSVLSEMEEAPFGWDHGEVGSWMGAAWEFPDQLVDVISDHHDLEPEDGPAPAAALVSLLDPPEDRERLDVLVELVNRHYAIPPDEVVQMIEGSRAEALSVAAMFE
jgi:HD-like signal output (HDOD) protein